MITVSNLSKNFDKRMLLDGVTLGIFPNEKIGLTGPNGAGKSTLFSIILGQMEPSSGSVSIQKNLRIGYMAQESKYDSQRTVMQELTSGDTHMRGLLEEKQKLEDSNQAHTDRYGDVLQELEAMGIYDLEHKAEKILVGLGFKEHEFHKPIAQLSGGWQMRTLLAKLLTYEYDLLLLDEPTNYLDLEATIWLKGYLANYRGTFIIISHDKIFLNDVTNYTIVLENAKMTKIKGNYQTYEEQKNVDYRTLEKQQKVIDKKREQLERFTERFHAQPNRASAVRNKRKMIEKLEEQSVELPVDRRSIKDFEFPVTQESGYTVCLMQNISKSYPDKKLYENVDLEIIRGQKICFVGPNGAGKSTFLKMIAGVNEPDTGTRKLGHQVSMGYFSQTRLDVLKPNNTVLEEILSAAAGSVPSAKARSLLGLFNYHGDDVFKPVSVLSGGEKSRLILAKLLINPPNFILLDEPTTHLDIDGVEALTTAFREYKGTLCFISHDLFFVKEIANHIIEVNDGELRHFHGGLDYYLDAKKRRDDESRDQARKAAERQRQEQKSQAKKSANEQWDPHLLELKTKHENALKRIEQIKKEIRKLQEEDKQLETESYVKARILNDPSKVRDQGVLKEFGIRLKEIQSRQREIAATILKLQEEHRNISK